MLPLRVLALGLVYLLCLSAVLWSVKTLVMAPVPTVLILLGCATAVFVAGALFIGAFNILRSLYSFRP